VNPSHVNIVRDMKPSVKVDFLFVMTALLFFACETPHLGVDAGADLDAASDAASGDGDGSVTDAADTERDGADAGSDGADAGTDGDTELGDGLPDGADYDAQDGDGGPGPGPEIWCATQWPIATLAADGYFTERLYARIWVEGVTPSAGANPALEVELGMGPAQVAPTDGTWHWLPADFNAACADCGNNDEWMGVVQAFEAGTFSWAARVRYQTGAWAYCDRADDGRVGSSDGWSPEDAPKIEVSVPGRLRVLSLNLRCLMDDWDRRLPILAAGIATVDPDLLGFQEVCSEPNASDNLAELLSALEVLTQKTYYLHRTVTHWSWDRYDEGLAVASPHRLASSTVVDLPAGLFPRKAILSRVITPQGPVVFATTHLDHQSSEARLLQIQTLLPELASFAQEQEVILLTGDMNEAPAGDVSSSLRQADFSDAWASLHPNEDGYTFPSVQPSVRIDYLWIRANSSDFVPEAIERILDLAVDGVYASDHVGISASVTR